MAEMTNIEQDLINEVNELINEIDSKGEDSPLMILKSLLENIGKLDFMTLAFPEYPNVLKEIDDFKNSIESNGFSLDEISKDEAKHYKTLQRKLNRFKLTKNHFLILCIEQLSMIAISNKWDLCKRNGFIYLYNGAYWVEIDKEHFESFLGSVSLKMGVEKFLAKIHTFKEQLYKQFLSDSYLVAPESKKNTVLINLLNGTFEINGKNQKLREFDKEDFLTYQLPFEYDPDATAPIFQKFLDEVIPDKSKQFVIAEFIGYLFVKTSVLKLEKVLILYGSGANGKSVFFEVINALLGVHNVSSFSLQSLTNEKGYFRAKIANKLLNYASEINGKLETDVFKKMASGEPIEARLPYAAPIILHDYAKLIFNCNELPVDVEHTNAFFRRFTIVNFDVTIPEEKQDKELSMKIIDNELAGVFNWVLDGLNRLLNQKNFSKCDDIDNARAKYEASSDSVKMFLDEDGYKRDANHHLLIKSLYQLYRAFCIEDGYRAVGKSKFITRLKHHKVTVTRIGIGNVAYLKKQEKDGVEF